eukprot:4366117-Amphidinium_carterae.1
MEKDRPGQLLTPTELVEKMSDFDLQFKGVERDIRGRTIQSDRGEDKTHLLSDIMRQALSANGPRVADVQYRVTASHGSSQFVEQLVMWLHAIGGSSRSTT